MHLIPILREHYFIKEKGGISHLCLPYGFGFFFKTTRGIFRTYCIYAELGSLPLISWRKLYFSMISLSVCLPETTLPIMSYFSTYFSEILHDNTLRECNFFLDLNFYTLTPTVELDHALRLVVIKLSITLTPNRTGFFFIR